MDEYKFSLIVANHPLTTGEILDITDALGNCGCTDVSIRGHVKGIELLFERNASSLQTAISSAIADVERSGYSVDLVEMERATIPS